MNRSGYIDDIDDVLAHGRWRAQVASATRGKRGQAFLRELAAAMDAMPVKELIRGTLVDEAGQCCTIGVVCKARGVDVARVCIDDPSEVGAAVGIARQLAAEVEYENDDCGEKFVLDPFLTGRWMRIRESPAERWVRMRKWVDRQIAKAK